MKKIKNILLFFPIGQDESPTDSSPHLEPYSMLFNRKERMDVKKPGPFFEASPNNFYLDKIISEEENENEETSENNDDNNNIENVDKNKTTKKVNDNNDPGQQEYEIPMSTSMEKRAEIVSKNPSIFVIKCQMCHSGPENLIKSRPKILVKSNMNQFHEKKILNIFSHKNLNFQKNGKYPKQNSVKLIHFISRVF